jgi:hypothetical protein
MLWPITGGSQSVQLSQKATVSVLTCGVGNEVYSLFGHTAIRINDPLLNIDIVYNYGAFDFETPNFVARFSKGDLQYFVTADRFEDFIYTYHYDRRSVWEQELALSASQKQQLFSELNTTMASDKKFYTYKFIDRNCTTMVVDILNRTLGSAVITKTDATDATYREVLFPYFDNHFYEQLGTSIIFGTKVDQDATHIFLPLELMKGIGEAPYQNRPLLTSEKTWLKFDVPKPEGSWWNNGYTYVLLLTLIVIANSRIVNIAYLSFAAAIGLFFTVAGFYSYHGELAWNYNALLFNPVLFLLVFYLIKHNDRIVSFISQFIIAGLFVYLILMLNKVHLVIVLPIVAAHAIILGRYVLRFRKMGKGSTMPA